MGIAVSCLVYRFLGGSGDATLVMKGVKITGSGAILVIVSIWTNSELKLYAPKVGVQYTPLDLTKHVIPSIDKWYAVSRDNGLPISLDFPLFKQVHNPPTYKEIGQSLIDRIIEIKHGDVGKIIAYLNDGKNISLGSITQNEINELGYYNDYTLQLEPYKVVTLSASQKIDINSGLPFILETKEFSDNYTSYVLISKKDNTILHEGAIYLRNAEVVELHKKFYLISIIEVNHVTQKIEPYAKFYIAELKIKNV